MTKEYWKYALLGVLNVPLLITLVKEFSITLWVLSLIGAQ